MFPQDKVLLCCGKVKGFSNGARPENSPVLSFIKLAQNCPQTKIDYENAERLTPYEPWWQRSLKAAPHLRSNHGNKKYRGQATEATENLGLSHGGDDHLGSNYRKDRKFRVKPRK